MATETQTKAPEITVINRVASIPLIASPLGYIHNAFSTNAYTKAPYSTAQGLGYTAWNLTEPIQVRLAPLISSADVYANKGLDAVETRFPYPFKAQPEDIASYVRERRTIAYDTANKRVVEPAFGIAKGVDQVSPRAYHDLICTISLSPIYSHLRRSSTSTLFRLESSAQRAQRYPRLPRQRDISINGHIGSAWTSRITFTCYLPRM